ncbi:BglG family transcription antiterminator [Sporolactobacillus shoreicorticis]|uniref:BglG family transcription antiterminator n=1 Tax=Sporolactobacillus shoreicorticis TaxID=1923877 RepID=A0ABW5RZ00_9BACL|nr:PRD domain-containing protein [Sporolactobacillus shoreicorticis]MCO7128094.1 BglG family transcription antiterminator [Sporolactobacillus shoreicorticis]
MNSMYMTNREKTILELLMKTSGRHSTLSMASYLQVSVRTVHRDLKNVEKLLKPFGLQLIQNQDKALQIQGPDKAVFRLVQELSKIKPVDLSAKERKLLLFLKLFAADEPMKTGPLAKELDISSTTLSGYLDELSAWTEDFDAHVVRKRGVGIQVIGSERSKRTALAHFYLFYFNEALIEAIFQINHSQLKRGVPVLHYFKSDYLSVIDQAMKQNLGKLYMELADSDYINFLIQVCIALQRFESGHPLEGEKVSEKQSSHEIEALPFIEKIGTLLSDQLGIELPDQEKAFMVTLLKGSRLQNAESIYFDQVITGKAIKKLIQHVSQQLQVDLTSDFSLFQGLMAHLEPSLFRIRKDLASFNPLTQQIIDQFPVLFKITEQALKQVFQQIQFPDDEIAFIVLHFGSALEQHKQVRNIRALIVCPTGIGASKMLAARLRKEMPELYSVHIASIHEMAHMDLDTFDLILSTVHLPKQKIPCLFVNPLLSKEDMAAIEQITRNLSKGGKGADLLPKRSAARSNASGRYSLQQLMNEVDQAQSAIRDLLKGFSVIQVRQAEKMNDVLLRLIDICFDQSIIEDREPVYWRLIERERMAGLAVPGTNMALFHCRDKSVRQLCFKMAHSSKHFELEAMDGGTCSVGTFLLMLAPEPLNSIAQEVISTISSSLVEDRESILTFASANEAMIRTKLEAIFYQFLIDKF